MAGMAGSPLLVGTGLARGSTIAFRARLSVRDTSYPKYVNNLYKVSSGVISLTRKAAK
jgi:hypothetical protein